MIGQNFDSASYTGPTEDFGVCYSRWKFAKDITSKIISSSATSFNTYLLETKPELVYDGLYLYCNSYGFDAAGSDYTPSLTFEFDQVRTLEKIFFMRRLGQNFELIHSFIEVSTNGQDFKTFHQITHEPQTQTFPMRIC